MSRTLIFVLGMGRSGTSALTRVLSLCGATLPENLLSANEGNALGHWEPQDALDLNEEFLSRSGASWYDPTMRFQEEVRFCSKEADAYVEDIKKFLEAIPTSPLAVIKEPRITAVSEFWFEAARQLGLAVRIVIAVRHPAEVAASLAARDRASPELSAALWLKYSLLAEQRTRSFARVFVEYANLLQDWRKEIARISAALSVDLRGSSESAIDEFVRPELRRQRHDGTAGDVLGLGLEERLYALMSAAARDAGPDIDALDEVFRSYRSWERVFRVSNDEFRARFAPQRHNVAKLMRAVAGRDSDALRSCLQSVWYRERNSDVFAQAIDPYTHWMSQGAAEGRLPSAEPLTLLDRLVEEAQSRPPRTLRFEGRTESRARIYQIYYSEGTRAELDPGFIPLDNTANERPDWREYWPMRNFLLRNSLERDTYYGFFSPRFRMKTRLDSSTVHDLLRRERGGADVVSFSPFFEQMVLPLNIIEQGICAHAECRDTFEQCAALIAPEFRTEESVMSSLNTIFCNYFVAKQPFWEEWLRACERIFELAEQSSTPLGQSLNRAVGYGAWAAPAKVFVIERVASLLLWSRPEWVAVYHNPLELAPSPAMIHPELIVMDALKVAYSRGGSKQCLQVYGQLRQRMIARQHGAAHAAQGVASAASA